MLALSAALLIAFAGGELPGLVTVPVHSSTDRTATEPNASQDPTGQPSNPVRWSAEQVRQWAAGASSGAALIQAERRSLGAGWDRRDKAAGAQIGLMQSVLGHVEDHERNRSAAEALELYHRLVGIEAQRELALEARQVLESLVRRAQRAEALDLPDGNVRELQGRQLAVQDQLTRLDFGERTARRRLARLTGQPLRTVESALLSDVLPRELASPRAEGALPIALANRGDLRAAEALCRCLGEDSLPAARAMMGILRTGMGLAAVASGSGSLLSVLHPDRGATSELRCRRQQCHLLQESIRESIADEVATAELALWEADSRLALAAQREELALAAAAEAESAVQLDQAPPGSDQLALLEALRLAGETLDRRLELALADVALREAQGILGRSPKRSGEE